jgi:alpha-L-fucosidase
MSTKTIIFIFFLTAILPIKKLSAQPYQNSWESIDSRPIPQWFTDAKFGIFIHWGLYSVPAWAPRESDGANMYDRETSWYWSRLTDPTNAAHHLFVDFHNKNYGEKFIYQNFANKFTCEMFSPAEWAKLFRESGAKYVILTSKHHEGFALWPSEYSWIWNSVDMGPHRDLAGDLSEAVKKEGLYMGFYYSLLEWFHPLYKNNIDKYVNEHVMPQMKELVNLYKPDILWPDGEWDYPSDKWRSAEFLAWLYNESPVKNTVVVNDRWGKETRSKHGGYYTTEYGLVHDATMDKNVHPWEECRGMGHSFGYNRNENIEEYSSSEQLVHILIEKVSGGGNLLLNIGPTADGRIPVIMQQRLIDIGKWLKVNGEAIYGTAAWDVASKQPDIHAYFTIKGKDVYVICTKYPDSPITIRNVGKKPVAVSLLGSRVKVHYSVNSKSVTITPPSLSPANNPCDYAWIFKLSGCL